MNIIILILKAVINLEKHRIREGRCANCTIPNLHPSSPDASLIFLRLLQLLLEALEELSILKFYLFGPQRRGGSWGEFFQRGEAEKVRRRAEKVASRAVFTPSEGKNKKGKNAVMGQKCTFSTLISVGKVKRIYRKRWEKWTNFRIS